MGSIAKLGSYPKSVISVRVGAEHACEFLEWLQPRPHGRVDPFEQVLFGAPRLLVAPEQLEGFLQVPGSDQRRVPPYERGKSLFLVVGQIPGILQQQPARALDLYLLFGAELAPKLAPGCID